MNTASGTNVQVIGQTHKLIDNIIERLAEDFDYDFDEEQRDKLRFAFASYGLSCVMDTRIAKEAEKVCQEQEQCRR